MVMTSPRDTAEATGPEAVGTLRRVVVVRTDDYWASVAATLTEDWVPRDPRTLTLHAISSRHFEQVRSHLERTSLYYRAGWRLGPCTEPVLHDDMIVAEDMDRIDDRALADLVRSELSVAQIEVVDGPLVVEPSWSERDDHEVTSRTWVSLGGWCGPSLGIRRLVGPQQRGAFDFLFSSLPGVDQAIFGDTDGYVPPRPFPMVDVVFNRPDEIAERAIIGSEHHRLPEFIHAHERFDLNPDTWDILQERLRRTREQLASHEGPLFLLRTVTSLDWRAERDLLLDLRRRLVEANPSCAPRLVAFVHSQHRATVRLPAMAPSIDTWAIQGAIGSLDEAGLPHTRYEAEYARVIQRITLDDEADGSARRWPPPPDVRRHEIHEHHEHWIF